MRLSEAVELVCGVLFFGSALLHAQTDERALRFLAVGLGGMAVVGYFASGRLKGWIGASYRELAEEMARLDAQLANRRGPDGSRLSMVEYDKLVQRRSQVMAKMAQHPDKPESWRSSGP